jgi:hypothetical protein
LKILPVCLWRISDFLTSAISWFTADFEKICSGEYEQLLQKKLRLYFSYQLVENIGRSILTPQQTPSLDLGVRINKQHSSGQSLAYFIAEEVIEAFEISFRNITVSIESG